MDYIELKPEKIKDLPPMEIGHMLLFNSKESSVPGAIFYIKESYENIRDMIQNLNVQFKDIVVEGGYSIPLIIMIKIANKDNLVYGQWFNKYNDTDRELIKEIVFQDKINFCVVDRDNNCKVRFICRNIYKRTIWEYFRIKDNDKKWSKDMFESDIISITSSLNSKVELFDIR